MYHLLSHLVLCLAIFVLCLTFNVKSSMVLIIQMSSESSIWRVSHLLCGKHIENSEYEVFLWHSNTSRLIVSRDPVYFDCSTKRIHEGQYREKCSSTILEKCNIYKCTLLLWNRLIHGNTCNWSYTSFSWSFAISLYTLLFLYKAQWWLKWNVLLCGVH